MQKEIDNKIQKIKFIEDCYKKGLNQYAARQQLFQGKHISHQLIKKIYQTMDSGGNIFEHIRTGGRPNVLDERLISVIDDYISSDGRRSVSEIQSHLKANEHVTVSSDTILRTLKLLGFRYRPPKKRPNITAENKNNRLKFARSMLQAEVPFRKIIFSDESRFCKDSDKGYVWYRPGETNESIYANLEKFSTSVMIYGAIGYNYKSKLVISNGNIDSDMYQKNIIESGMLNKNPDDYIFMQDGAPAHKSKSSLNWLRQKMNLLAIWPANSPDLNPIEHLWGYMKREVRKLNPKNKQELINIIIQIWNNIPMEIINHLVDSFEERLKMVCNLNGECINDYLRMKKEMRPINNVQIPPDCILFTKAELIASYDPSLPDFYCNKGKELTESEINFLVNKLINWKKIKPLPINRWANEMKRPREEIEKAITLIKTKVLIPFQIQHQINDQQGAPHPLQPPIF